MVDPLADVWPRVSVILFTVGRRIGLGNAMGELVVERGAAGKWFWQINLPVITTALPELEKNPLLPADGFSGPAVFIAGAKSNYIEPKDHARIRRHFPIAKIHVLAFGDVGIPAADPLIAGGGPAHLSDILIVGAVGERNVLRQDLGRDGIEAGSGDGVVGEKLVVVERIGDAVFGGGEIAAPLGLGGRAGGAAHLVFADAQTLVREEEEVLVPLYRAAVGEAELIEAQLGDAAGEEAAGIEIVVA